MVGDHVAIRNSLRLSRRVREVRVVTQGELSCELSDLVGEVLHGGLVRRNLIGQTLRLGLGTASLLLCGVAVGDG